MILASSFDAVIYMAGFPAAALFVLLGILSFVPAKSRFKSDLVLAITAIAGGALLTCWIALEPRKDHLMPEMWVVFPLPLILGVISLSFWFCRRK